VEALANTREAPMAPDEAAFRADIAAPRFLQGVDRGRWRLVTLDWPHAVIAITSAPRENGPSEIALRFQLEGFPQNPTACPWDLETDAPLAPEKRPKGDRAGMAFRHDWQEALYVPWDRIAIEGHGAWPARHAGQLWDPDEGISCYLRHTHSLLNDEDYEGV